MRAIPQWRWDGTQISGLADLYRKFSAARGASPRTLDSYDLAFRQFLGFLQGIGKQDDLRNFTPETVNGFATYLAESGLKSSTVLVRMAALSSLGEFGVKTQDQRGKYYLAENPLTRVYRPKRERPREKYLALEELRRILAAPGSAQVKLALALLVDTQCRASEITNANVEDLRLDGYRAILSIRVKGGARHEITLGQDVAAMLLESLKYREPKATDPLVVSEKGHRFSRTTLSEAVLRQARNAGVTRIPVRAHVIRHTMATLAVAGGADIPTVAGMLNHSDLSTVSRYVHRKGAVDAARESVRNTLQQHNPPNATG